MLVAQKFQKMMSQVGSKRGALIVFEGCDRVGKSTQCKLLANELQSRGIPTQQLHFPGKPAIIN